MSQTPDGSVGVPEADRDPETRRIRDVYAARDRRPGRSHALQRAYDLLNDERRAATLEVIRRTFGNVGDPYPSIVDVGCGSGLDLADLMTRGWPADRLAGVDLVADRLATAGERCPGVRLELVDGTCLPFDDSSVDIAVAVTVFSSILNSGARRALFADMLRVVSPGGLVLVYDFVVRKPRNQDVIAMPLRRLAAMAGRPPEFSIRLSPFLYAVGLASMLGSGAARAAMRVAPPTHRLSVWHAAQVDF